MLTTVSPNYAGSEDDALLAAIPKKNLKEWAEEDMAQVARTYVSTTKNAKGDFLAQTSSPDAEEILMGIEEQHFTNLFRSLQIGAPIDFSPIAVDGLGQLDVEHGNPGPEISPKGQLTFAPYAHLSNSKEIESKKVKERKRMLQSLSLHPPTMEKGEDANPKDLWFEREALSRSSSVSSISTVSDMGQPSDEYPQIGRAHV